MSLVEITIAKRHQGLFAGQVALVTGASHGIGPNQAPPKIHQPSTGTRAM